MQQTCLITALLLICGCGDDITNVYGSPAAGTGGESATVGSGGTGGDVADGGGAGLGGEPGSGGEAPGGSGGAGGGGGGDATGGTGGGTGGAGGAGGAPCQSKGCDDYPALCGVMDDGCGSTVDCTPAADYDTCGTHDGMLCNINTWECACGFIPQMDGWCNDSGHQGHCAGQPGCRAGDCGPSGNPDIPSECQFSASLQAYGQVWCCHD